jgi:sporulation protein YlmC with PRC-barrel domain
MGIKVSQLYGMDIYSDEGGFLGKINDIIINLEKGEVVRVTTEPLKSVSKEEARKILRDKSVLYKNVRSVRDIMIVSKRGGAGSDIEEEAEDAAIAAAPAKRTPAFFGSSRSKR